MILFELTESENHPLYRALELSNGNRQYDFLRSIIGIAIEANKRFLSQHVIKAFNFQAITCLHTNPGEYRPCPVRVVSGDVVTFAPPDFYRVQALMDDFVNVVNSKWATTDPLVLASYVLWRLNYIHPFINGNGRTARATCYFVLCLAVGYWLPGTTILPELIKRERDAYCIALAQVDQSFAAGQLDVTPLHSLLSVLLTEQMATAGIVADDNAAPGEQPAPGA
jgi:hypothetical protein